MLSIDNSRRPSLPCERFHNWYHDLNPQSITLVFPSAYMNNPSSMFGHTLLRIDQKGQTEQTWILAYTIETLVNIVSLSPMDSLFKAPSWKVNIGKCPAQPLCVLQHRTTMPESALQSSRMC